MVWSLRSASVVLKRLSYFARRRWNLFSVLSRLYHEKGEMTTFYFECLRWQHVADELRVKRACCRLD
jgi:hypothetical protein